MITRSLAALYTSAGRLKTRIMANTRSKLHTSVAISTAIQDPSCGRAASRSLRLVIRGYEIVAFLFEGILHLRSAASAEGEDQEGCEN